MENFSTVNLTRRNFVKGSLAAAGAVALASAAPAVKPFEAFAATEITEGVTYSVNAEFYISKKILLLGFNAYLTNASDPNAGEGRPTTPNGTLNATLVKEGGKYYVTIPLINPCFVLVSASKGDGIDVEDYKTKTGKYKDTSGNDVTQISEITLSVTAQNDTFTLGSCKEYGAYTDAPSILGIPGYVTWPATVEINWSSAQAVSE